MATVSIKVSLTILLSKRVFTPPDLKLKTVQKCSVKLVVSIKLGKHHGHSQNIHKSFFVQIGSSLINKDYKGI